MSQFYVSMIFIGIILVLISLIWVAYDRNKGNGYEKKLEEKKDELVGIIADAEQMISELNKFSDYIVTQVNTKQEELMAGLRHFDEIKGEIKTRAVEEPPREAAPEVFVPAPAAKPKTKVKALDNVINLNKRNYEVLRLASRGLNNTEIAKMLNIGKGEVELILQLNKQVIG